MRHVSRIVGLVAFMIAIQACSHEDQASLLVPGNPETRDDGGRIGAFGGNVCPLADNLAVMAPSGSAIFQLPATDPDNAPNPLTWQVSAPPTHGTVAVQTATGAASYAALPGYCGPDSFRFRVFDGQCTSPEATVSIVVCGGPPPDSDLSENVFVGKCDTGVENLIKGEAVGENGCSLADIIHGLLVQAAAKAPNHGQFVRTMARSLTELGRLGVIGVSEHGAIMRCVSQADVEDFQP